MIAKLLGYVADRLGGSLGIKPSCPEQKPYLLFLFFLYLFISSLMRMEHKFLRFSQGHCTVGQSPSSDGLESLAKAGFRCDYVLHFDDHHW